MRRVRDCGASYLRFVSSPVLGEILNRGSNIRLIHPKLSFRVDIHGDAKQQKGTKSTLSVFVIQLQHIHAELHRRSQIYASDQRLLWLQP